MDPNRKKENALTPTVAMDIAAANPSTNGAAAASTSKQARPKRARTKTEKKDIPETYSRFHCNYCNRDLSSQIRVRCAVCADYDSCLDCFSVGAALHPHEPSHAYRLIQVVHQPIFQESWSADEEDKLLEGLEMYGVGNWEQVAKSVETKTADETEEHFLRVYMHSQHAPLPDPTAFLSRVNPAADKDADVDPKTLRVMHKYQLEDAAGWMPRRQDFVYEWDNEAEDILGDMEISEEDSAKDRELKLQVLEIYNTKLDERKKRKEFVTERGLTDNFKGYLAAEKKRPRDEKDIRDKLRAFSRFLSAHHMDMFIAGLVEERTLRANLGVYTAGRRLGATTVAECTRLAHGKARARPPLGTGIDEAMHANGDAVMEENSSAGSDVAQLSASVLGRDPEPAAQAGAELLSRTELGLCTSLKVSVHQYMIVKEVLIRESARLGTLKKKDAKAMVRLDQVKVFKIYDYLSACGWIRSGSNAPAGGGAGATTPRSAPPSATPNGSRPN